MIAFLIEIQWKCENSKNTPKPEHPWALLGFLNTAAFKLEEITLFSFTGQLPVWITALIHSGVKNLYQKQLTRAVAFGQ